MDQIGLQGNIRGLGQADPDMTYRHQLPGSFGRSNLRFGGAIRSKAETETRLHKFNAPVALPGAQSSQICLLEIKSLARAGDSSGVPPLKWSTNWDMMVLLFAR